MVWEKIESKADIDKLLDTFGGFHDSCLREAHVWTGHYVTDELAMVCDDQLDTHIRMLFQRQAAGTSAIEILFDQVIRFNLVPSPENYVSIIFDATLLSRDDAIYWAETAGWTPGSADRDGVTWVAAKAMSWRDASPWMGSKLNYGPSEINE
jgi:hypothetical protein